MEQTYIKGLGLFYALTVCIVPISQRCTVVAAPVSQKHFSPLDTVTGRNQQSTTVAPDLNFNLGLESDPDHSTARKQHKTDNLLQQLHHYEIVVPTLVDHRGDFISYDVTQDAPHVRRKRSLDYVKRETDALNNISQTENTFSGTLEDELIYYRLSAFGMEFHLNLSLNKNLVSPSFTSELWTENGQVDKRNSHIHDCHYIGHLSSDTSSTVAVSNCNGLHGVFATSEDEFFVEPLWNDTKSLDDDGYFHVVYKRSAIKNWHMENHCGVADNSNTTLPHWWLPTSPWAFNKLLKPHHHGYHNKDKWRKRRRSKRSVSVERHVETLVVVDKMMVAYHGRKEIEPYVLTVMNIVAKLYHDATIGNAINIIVTRLVQLLEKQPKLEITHHADRSLESFCLWQQAINPKEDSNNAQDLGVAHHDNAVLLTRYDICTYKNEPCGTLGLAPVAGMCEPDRSCSINEDIGLASAFTVAHEIGHNFGMQHDGAGNNCGTPGYEPAKIMASQLTKNTDPFSWSGCSRQYISEFLDSGRGQCLEKAPSKADIFFPTVLPGQLHDADTQCKYQFGSKSHQCKYGAVCKELWCTNPSNHCVTNSIPAAEGTSCSSGAIKKGWCYQGECTKMGYRPGSVDGAWSGWSEWGQCSRTCDGGVSSSERLCNNPTPVHGGNYCTGERKRYRSCNVLDCPINSTDFREVQCATFNEVSFRGKYYKWKPFSGDGSEQANQMKPCALNCMATGYNFYTERKPKVIDGTRCYPDSLDMCINGECHHVGCDHQLHSDAVEDKCRVCGGDGGTCQTVKGIFDIPLEKGAYKEVIRIPQGAVHITITETAASRNYLALRSVSNNYYINGAWTIDWPRKFEVANTVFHYIRPKEGLETISALGPTSEDLILMILLQETNKGIKYQYTMPVSNHSKNGTEFVWQYVPWTKCTVSCAKGTSSSVAVCVRKDDRTMVKNKYCEHAVKPKDRMKYCNKDPCPAVWQVDEWTDCSKTCGGGSQKRTVLCVRRVDQTETEVLDHKHCLTKRPEFKRLCNKEKCPPHWATDGWSDCRATCGASVQNRNVYCVSAEGQYLHERHCDSSNKPPNQKKCNHGACPPPRWAKGAWGPCSAKCGLGQQRRSVQCRTHDRKASDECDNRLEPSNIRQCEGVCKVEVKECKDVNKVAYCPLVLKFKFCGRPYFRQMCCKTCSAAGF